MRLVCGILVKPNGSLHPDIAAKARSLTITWLRWSYFGEIIEGSSVDDILQKSSKAGFDFCFIQGAGHILPDQWSAKQDQSLEFFHSLRAYIETTDFLVAGEKVFTSHGEGLLSRWLVINLGHYRRLGYPQFSGTPEGNEMVRLSLTMGLAISELDPMTRRLMLDLGEDLSLRPDFLEGLMGRSGRATKGVFPWNYESYEDVMEPPPVWRGPVATLYSVAAGLKPNMILETHGFDNETEIVFFDYSPRALSFQELLKQEWDGCDYPHFLKYAVRRLPEDTFYYLWPGASLEYSESPEMQALWQREIARWGGEAALREHWSRARKLKHTYLPCNLITAPETLLNAMTDRPGTILWWSNSFQTAFSSCNFTVDAKRLIYERWIRSLASKSPELLLYGSDHGNSSVNGMTASEYLSAYEKVDGGPLAERKLHRQVIRF